MKKIILASFLLLGFCGGALFHVKYQVTQISDQLKTTKQTIQDTSQALCLLQAEWAYLNEPNRLESLSEKYLTLSRAKPSQILKLSDLKLFVQQFHSPVKTRLKGA